MSDIINSTLIGAVAMASLVATLFFLRFWRQTKDSFFLLFAIAFAIDAVFRFILGMNTFPNETEPLFYLPRLAMFGLIILAVIQKNRPSSS
jgi:hypothetical protein